LEAPDGEANIRFLIRWARINDCIIYQKPSLAFNTARECNEYLSNRENATGHQVSSSFLAFPLLRSPPEAALKVPARLFVTAFFPRQEHLVPPFSK
jgi:hypothetical protein